MTAELWLRLGEAVHGYLGWLTVAALLHPTILLRRSGGTPRWAVRTALLLVTLAALGGATLYPWFRTEVRPELFQRSRFIGWWFERKESLGVLAFTLAWAGGVSAWLASVPGPRSRVFRRTAALAFALSAAAAALTAAAGTASRVMASF